MRPEGLWQQSDEVSLHFQRLLELAKRRGWGQPAGVAGADNMFGDSLWGGGGDDTVRCWRGSRDGSGWEEGRYAV